jgi:hypothetical protein
MPRLLRFWNRPKKSSHDKAAQHSARFTHLTPMKNEIQKLLAGSALLLFTLACGCNKQQPATSASNEPEAESQGSLETRIDAHGEEIMASSAKAEAREWIKKPSHIFFKANPKEVAQFIEEFYSAGASQVLVGDIEEHEGNAFGEALLVILPKDSANRLKLFEVGSRADTAFQNDPITDKGQKYLYYSLD